MLAREHWAQTPAFDALYSVSDLHLGGAEGHQIFDQGRLLGDTIRRLAAIRPRERVALVINGDMLDYLAEPAPRYLNREDPGTVLKEVAGRPAFKPVFDGLEQFVGTPGRTLVIVVGNHDVELSLPSCQRALEHLVCRTPAARARLAFAVDGAGFSALVGKARVHCVHGNDVDAWNVVDHEAVRRQVAALNIGAELPDWEPNAGTQLVIDVMNDVKRRFPIVDLLKPETRPVPAVLAALDRTVLLKLSRTAPILLRKSRAERRLGVSLLSGAEDRTADARFTEADALRELLPRSRNRARRGADVLREAEQALADRDGEPIDWDRLRAEGQQALGLVGLAVDTVLRRDARENLREALQDWLAADHTFELRDVDQTFARLDQLAGTEIDFLLAGHTHLARSLPRTRGGGHYFNTGTWVRLVQLRESDLARPEAFGRVYNAFLAGSMAALDEQEDLVLRRPTVAGIEATSTGVTGQLLSASSLPGGEVDLDPMPGGRAE